MQAALSQYVLMMRADANGATAHLAYTEVGMQAGSVCCGLHRCIKNAGNATMACAVQVRRNKH